MSGAGDGPLRGESPARRTKPAPTAYNRALDALARRARSTTELARWLQQRDFEPDDIADVIERLTSAGFLNDVKFAELFARSRLLDRKLSSRRVLAELGRRGIPRAVAVAAVRGVTEDEGVDEDAAAQSVAARKLRSMGSLDPSVAKRRLFAFLARRGYDADVIRRTVVRLVTHQTAE